MLEIDATVRDACRRLNRADFCPADQKAFADDDRPLPIGYGQTISQPSLVAFSTSVLHIQPGEKILEIGTGSGYQAALLAELGARVFSIEIVAPLGNRALRTLRSLGYDDVRIRIGDGYLGWPDEAPFDAITLTAAPESLPETLLEQLKPGSGRLLVPEGPQNAGGQTLRLYRKSETGEVDSSDLLAVRFVPMVHAAANATDAEP
jgi:protein-L-isoaspartate(D-aspartate) O-methyltransferase